MPKSKKEMRVDTVVSHIKNAILEGDYKPGDRIKETAIAEALDVSRAPVREALLELFSYGLLESKPHRGKSVIALTSKQILESYIMGGVLEGYALACSVHLFFDGDYKKLENLLDQMREVAATTRDLHVLSELDTQFHDLLLSKTDNEMLLEFSQRTSRNIAHFLLFRHWAKIQDPDVFHARHMKILNAMRQGDRGQIEKVIRTHYMECGYQMAEFGADRYED
jgi:DNA-binding GntR family transcriptional regulator